MSFKLRVGKLSMILSRFWCWKWKEP